MILGFLHTARAAENQKEFSGGVLAGYKYATPTGVKSVLTNARRWNKLLNGSPGKICGSSHRVYALVANARLLAQSTTETMGAHLFNRLPQRRHLRDFAFRRFAQDALFFCCLLFFLCSNAAQPFLTPDSTVILLSGLPGDLESETTYHDYLQGWLEALNHVGHKGKTIVLADRVEGLPSGVETVSATRSNFLEIAQNLSKQSVPAVVIAWGHGGKQGSKAVFHVRGPRLTPEDFATLAARFGGPSTWLLCFRGSGQFARQLAAEGREILSSEGDTMFGSDPIVMSIALKTIRNSPEVSCAEFAREVGLATAAWYKERNLARTEEPTLWLNAEQPRLLAGTEEENSLAADPHPNGGTNDTKTTTNSVAASATNNPSLNSTNLSAAWKDIQKVDAKQFPDSDAVSLRRRVSYTLARSPAVSSEQEEFIQILSAEGKRFGDFDVSFSPPGEDLTFQDCEVLSPSGTIHRLDPDQIRETREESVGDYQRGRRKFFSLPGVAPGAIMHIRYRREWKEFPLPYISLHVPVIEELPAIDSSIEITVPKTSAFHFGFDGVTSDEKEGTAAAQFSKDPVTHESDYGRTYAWRSKQLPAAVRESLMPPHPPARLVLSTFPDWPAFADWYGRLTKLTDEITPEIEARAAELTRDAKSDRAKVLALYNYVTALRYVAVPLGVNSYRPHAAANVLQNSFGDCKDKANLFNAFLHTMHLDAQLVLVPRFSQAHESVPGFAFNHAISRVTLGGETVWVDTTDDVCRFGLLPPGDPGRRVLVIAAGTNTLTQLPVPNAQDHELKLQGEVDCSGSAWESLPVRLTVIATGYPDYEMRATSRETRERNSTLPLLAARFRPAAGSFALEKQTSTSIAALDENFTWQAEGALLGTASRSLQVTNSTRSLRAAFWIPKEWDVALHHRRSPLFLNQGYPLTLDEEIEFKLPPASRADKTPAIENKEPPLRWRIEWAKVPDAKLAARFHAELVEGELSSEETIQFQKELASLFSALATESVIHN